MHRPTGHPFIHPTNVYSELGLRGLRYSGGSDFLWPDTKHPKTVYFIIFYHNLVLLVFRVFPNKTKIIPPYNLT